MAKKMIMNGNEACLRGALAAGMRFFAGYPITPATEISELASEMLPVCGGTYIQMEDELASAAAVVGASAAGVMAMTATSGPGFSLMQEELGYAYMAEIPCVVVDVMRSGPSSGVATLPGQGDLMQARWGSHGDKGVIALSPNSVQEVYDETIRAFRLSERYRMPVIIIYDAVIAHMSEKITILDEEEIEPVIRQLPKGDREEYLPYNIKDDKVTPLASFGQGYDFLLESLSHDDSGFPLAVNDRREIESLIRHLRYKTGVDYHEVIEKNEILDCEDAQIIFVALGISSRSCYEAMKICREKGIKAGLFRPVTLWPFPEETFMKQTAAAQILMSVEMNQGQLAEIVRGLRKDGQRLVPIRQSDGQIISCETIMRYIEEVLR